MEVIIRDVAERDQAAARAVQDAAFALVRTVYRPCPKAVAAPTGKNYVRHRLVAVFCEEVVGTVGYEVQVDRLHVIGLAVHPKYHRCGIGRQLMDHLAEFARGQGLRSLSLYTVEETGNVPIFLRLSFAVVSRNPAEDLESVMGNELMEAFMMRAL